MPEDAAGWATSALKGRRPRSLSRVLPKIAAHRGAVSSRSFPKQKGLQWQPLKDLRGGGKNRTTVQDRKSNASIRKMNDGSSGCMRFASHIWPGYTLKVNIVVTWTLEYKKVKNLMWHTFTKVSNKLTCNWRRKSYFQMWAVSLSNVDKLTENRQ